ncbi:uncharacterized protein K02A2.6-like [Microplitis mediator]|uniref:uncharacterized protein K02A2.6-like n=1 Tax=Microplitis mediator TaxID=375433 RepID=UPI0025565A8A|nr:uncharacterized protein K02A2.6-like [Microplitis mediator]
MTTDTPFEPFEKISIDTVGPLPMTRSRNVHILTIQDNFSKDVTAIPIPDIRSTTVAEALVDRYMCYYGYPRVILSDKGTSFTSKIIQQLAKALKIQRLTTSGYYLQSNGSLERSHQPLIDFLRVISDKYPNWDRYVGLAALSYNTNVHTSTKFTTFELMFGRRARLPTQFPDYSRIETYSDYLVDLMGRLSEVREIAADCLNKAKQDSKIRYDRNIHARTFKVGDFIYVLKEPRKNKLDVYYTGPYEIVDINEFGSLIYLNDKGNRKLVNPNKAKPAFDQKAKPL